MRAGIDRDECCGYGMCISTAPDYFALDGEGLGSAVDRTVDEADVGRLREAVLGCPANAVWLADSPDDVRGAA